VAAEEIFETYWVPICNLLGLRWIRQFQYGLEVKRTDLEQILNELVILKQFLSKEPKPNLPNGIAAHILERVNLIISALEGIRHNPQVDAYIV